RKKVFAVGHGCACDWSLDSMGQCGRIWTECLPTYELSPISHVELPGLSLSMRALAHDSDSIALCDELASAYQAWIDDQRKRIADPRDVPPGFRELAESNLKNGELCLSRIRKGIELLRTD